MFPSSDLAEMSQGISRFASLSGVFPHKLVWGIVRSFLGFELVCAGGGGGGSVTIVQYQSGLCICLRVGFNVVGWPTIGKVAYVRCGM